METDRFLSRNHNSTFKIVNSFQFEKSSFTLFYLNRRHSRSKGLSQITLPIPAISIHVSNLEVIHSVVIKSDHKPKRKTPISQLNRGHRKLHYHQSLKTFSSQHYYSLLFFHCSHRFSVNKCILISL